MILFIDNGKLITHTWSAVIGPKTVSSSMESFERFTGLSVPWGGWATATLDKSWTRQGLSEEQQIFFFLKHQLHGCDKTHPRASAPLCY